MLTYWKKENSQLRQIESEDTPFLLKETINSNEWFQISKSEYDSLMPKDELIDAAAPTEDDYTDLSYLYDDVVESPTNDVTPKVEEVVEEKPINPHRL